jgi:uncharacterized protein
VPVRPGSRHRQIFTRLGGRAGVSGHLVLDADLAALAIESGALWITTERGYARYEGLRFAHPLVDR